MKNVIVFISENQIWKWRLFETRAIFDLLFTFFRHQEKDKKILQYIVSLTKIHDFAHPVDLFAISILKKIKKIKKIKKNKIKHIVWFLFGATHGVDSCLRHFGAINK